MKPNRIVLLAVLVLLCAAAGWWGMQYFQPHRHELVRAVDAAGKVYYTCPMHPQVHQDHPGNCPICGMQLVREETPSTAAPDDKKVLYWYDPMKPEVHFDKAGKSPFMDMELVPKYETADAGDVVQIDPRMAQNLGVRTATVSATGDAEGIDVVGSVEVDERRIYVIESRTAGWVEQLRVRAVGELVRRGQTVAGVYSPDLYAAQQEFTLALGTKNAALADAARQRLLSLGASEAQIRRIEASGTPERRTDVVTPSGGVVTELIAREGQQVGPGMPLMKLADLSQVWVTVEVPEAQAAGVTVGQVAEARLQAIPGKTFQGKVDFIYPRLDTATRTVRARLSFPNTTTAMKPGMYAQVHIAGAVHAKSLSVPSEAVIRTGTRTMVILAEGEGRFRPVAVTLGPEVGDRITILSGLSDGQTIVVSGQFLIDSEASLRGAFERMQAPEAQP